MVILHLLILIYLTVVKCFQTSTPSPQPKYLNYFGQCQTNHHAWLHPDITPEIMCRHFLHPHLTLSKPIFHTGHFSIQVLTGTYLTPAEKTWFTEIGSRKFQTDIQSEYHRQNPWASCPSKFFSLHFSGWRVVELLDPVCILMMTIWVVYHFFRKGSRIRFSMVDLFSRSFI